MKRIVAQIAADHLRATNNQSVGVGDVHLLHEIASLAGIRQDGPPTQRRVLDAIDRSHPGHLIKGYTKTPNWWRQFWLPEHAPIRIKTVMGGCGCQTCCDFSTLKYTTGKDQ